jgi:AraC family transcriptional regulator, activator of mtrCDE
MDVLSDILDLLQLRGTLYFRTAFAPPWSVTVPAFGKTARFHLVVEGQCHVLIDDRHDILLNPGDLIVIPGGAAHTLCDSPATAPTALDDVLQRTGYTGEGVLAYCAGEPSGATTKLICGHLNFAEGADHPLLRALPDHLLVTPELRAGAAWLDEILQLILRQMFAGSPGSQASAIRLSEAMFIEIIRVCAEQSPALQGIVKGLADARIGKALHLMHGDLEKDWTLVRIARAIGMSRSRFADRFQATMGCAPMAYLAGLRLQKAKNLLAGTRQQVQIVAAQVGYRSPAAFSRAFANRFGHSPRDARRAA